MPWSKQAIQDASQAGNYGRVIQLARRAQGFTQRQVGEACDLTQSAVSRLEGRGDGPYNMATLATLAAYLEISPRLVGLADTSAAHATRQNGRRSVERRRVLAGAVAVTAVPAVPALAAATESAETGQIAAFRLATTAFRRADGSTPARQLTEAVLAHLRLVQNVAAEATDEQHRQRLAAAGSEAASLAGWLGWDMGDHGSARTWYGAAIKAARRSGDRLLAAYQMGSLAQLEADAGNAAQGLTMARSARRRLSTDVPAVADAWLCTVEALAHAAAGDAVSADRTLVRARRAASRIAAQEPPPWPWVFTFTEAKVAACRLTCGARLGLPSWVFGARDEAAAAMSSAPAKQGALTQLDLADGHQAAGRLDAAYALATKAVETGLRYRSGRVLERARIFRRGCNSSTPPKVVREFDDRLYGVFM